MKWIARGAIALMVLLLFAPAVLAQEDHGEFGVFADYTRFHNLNNQNFWGVGARVAFNMNKWSQLEASMAYDFERQFVSSGQTVGTFNNTRFRILDGLFGPKFYVPAGPVRIFGTIKGGFTNFSVTNTNAVGSGFVSSINSVPSGDTHFALYPGGGIELFAKWIGVRAEIGDEIYWQGKFTTNTGSTFGGGAQHNLKFSIGPQFRW